MGRLLIVGAGVAGTTLAALAARSGWQVTVVERAGALRHGGVTVDVRGPALDVVSRLGVLEQLHARQSPTRSIHIHGDDGTVVATLPPQHPDGIEVPRGDLVEVLAAASDGAVEMIHDLGPTVIRQVRGSVNVCFADGDKREFDLVVGADGALSTVRALMFGAESRFITPMGLHVVTAWFDDIEPAAAGEGAVTVRNAPGLMSLTHPMSGRRGAAFIFRTRQPWPPGGDVRAWVRTLYRTHEWELVDRLGEVPDQDLWHEPVNLVQVPQWWSQRVVLLGDAAGCVSLWGEGTSLAIVGAATLADALAELDVRDESAVRSALLGYQRSHARRVAARRRTAVMTARLLVPQTERDLRVRNRMARSASAALGGRRLLPL